MVGQTVISGCCNWRRKSKTGWWGSLRVETISARFVGSEVARCAEARKLVLVSAMEVGSDVGFGLVARIDNFGHVARVV
ncbi:F27F5.4 [Arabidopsis thaliana]|uniref:F27F5.4 n=1 Tax=Arabidopsis thaliana TaxID=3702 RepID=Q9MAL2_ARATH|nr:F27F5.4 [Arabidopsis thaliana]